jgi:hypothetical protein
MTRTSGRLRATRRLVLKISTAARSPFDDTDIRSRLSIGRLGSTVLDTEHPRSGEPGGAILILECLGEMNRTEASRRPDGHVSRS